MESPDGLPKVAGSLIILSVYIISISMYASQSLSVGLVLPQWRRCLSVVYEFASIE